MPLRDVGTSTSGLGACSLTRRSQHKCRLLGAQAAVGPVGVAAWRPANLSLQPLRPSQAWRSCSLMARSEVLTVELLVMPRWQHPSLERSTMAPAGLSRLRGSTRMTSRSSRSTVQTIHTMNQCLLLTENMTTESAGQGQQQHSLLHAELEAGKPR